MKKTIQVIIKNTNSPLGPVNTIKSVSLGYAFNYLIPNNIVEIASKGRIKHINMLQNIQSKQNKKINQQNLDIKSNLDEIKKISIRKKLGSNQQIFGSVTEYEISEKIFMLTGKQLDKKQITIPSIKEIGIYKINIKIEENISSEIKLQILPKGL